MADGALPPEVAALSSTLLRTFRTAFSTFDAAGEGTIITSDLPLALRALSLNPTDRELKALSDELVRGSSAIPFVLFCQIAARLHAAVRTPAALARLFAQWDPSNSGAITQAAMREVFGKMSPTPLVPLEALDALIAYAGACGRAASVVARAPPRHFSHSLSPPWLPRARGRPWRVWHDQVRRVLRAPLQGL
jgi:Ca2+-binding EF-hand superfamily protein